MIYGFLVSDGSSFLSIGGGLDFFIEDGAVMLAGFVSEGEDEAHRKLLFLMDC